MPGLAWSRLGRATWDAKVYRRVQELLLFGFAFAWWLVQVAPRLPSVRTSLGLPISPAGWRLVAVALFGATSLRITWLLGGSWWRIWQAFGTGGYYSFNLGGGGHTDPWVLVIGTTLGPFVEELVSRGSLFRKWRVQWGPGRAALLTSVLFGAMHPQHVAAFIMGLTYVLAYVRARTLWAPIVLHCLNNSGIYGLDLLRHLTDAPRLRLNTPWEYLAFVLVLLAGSGLWARFVRGSWRRLGDPLPPDSLNAERAHSPPGDPEPREGTLRVAS